MGFPDSSVGKESACNAGDLGSIPGFGKIPREGKGYPVQYSCLKNSMDGIVHGVAKSQTRLSNFHFHDRTIPLVLFFFFFCIFLPRTGATSVHTSVTLWILSVTSTSYVYREDFFPLITFFYCICMIRFTHTHIHTHTHTRSYSSKKADDLLFLLKRIQGNYHHVLL